MASSQFDSWADSVVHLLPLKMFMSRLSDLIREAAEAGARNGELEKRKMKVLTGKMQNRTVCIRPFRIETVYLWSELFYP